MSRRMVSATFLLWVATLFSLGSILAWTCAQHIKRVVEQTPKISSPARVMALAPSPMLKRGMIPKSLTNLKIVAQASPSSWDERTTHEAKKRPVGVDVPI